MDEDGNVKQFHLLVEVSSIWRDAALRLGLGMDAIKNYKQKTDDDVERFEYVMSYWIENCAEHKEYPATWRGLIELLESLERSTAALSLRKALERREH